MKIAKPKQRLARAWAIVYILDAPGITGMGIDSFKRMKDHADAGGTSWHPRRIRIA